MKPQLKHLLDSIASNPELSPEATDMIMAEAFALAETSDERREAGIYLSEAISKRKRNDLDVKNILGEMAEALNLSYIAKCYFNKDKSWLYPRLNHATVNGKQAAFSETELKRLSESLEDISNKIHQISVQLTHQFS